MISKFNGTSTPKGSYSAKTGIKLSYESKQESTRKECYGEMSAKSKVRCQVVHIDATGSLLTKIPGQQKSILYYAMVIENTAERKTGIPVAEMPSNDQKSTEIQHFVARFLHAAAGGEALSTAVPCQVETDYSWAIIQATLSAFNKEDCQGYLKRVWDLVHGKSNSCKGYTYLHLCAAHALTDAARHAVEVSNDKGLRQFFLYCFGLLQTSSSLEEAVAIFRDMCQVFHGEHENALQKRSPEKLKSMISHEQKDFTQEAEKKLKTPTY